MNLKEPLVYSSTGRIISGKAIQYLFFSQNSGSPSDADPAKYKFDYFIDFYDFWLFVKLVPYKISQQQLLAFSLTFSDNGDLPRDGSQALNIIPLYTIHSSFKNLEQIKDEEEFKRIEKEWNAHLKKEQEKAKKKVETPPESTESQEVPPEKK